MSRAGATKYGRTLSLLLANRGLRSQEENPPTRDRKSLGLQSSGAIVTSIPSMSLLSFNWQDRREPVDR